MPDVFSFIPSWVWETLGWLYLYNLLVKAILASTPTPSTEKWYGKLYRFFEWTVLVIGKVKEQSP